VLPNEVLTYLKSLNYTEYYSTVSFNNVGSGTVYLNASTGEIKIGGMPTVSGNTRPYFEMVFPVY
jgi:hypothetical protein